MFVVWNCLILFICLSLLISCVVLSFLSLIDIRVFILFGCSCLLIWIVKLLIIFEFINLLICFCIVFCDNERILVSMVIGVCELCFNILRSLWFFVFKFIYMVVFLIDK